MAEFDPRAYWEQRLERSTGLEGVGYMGLGQAFNSWTYRVRRHVFLHFVRSHRIDLSGKAVLDIGSGTGFYLRCWKALGAESITGSDITDTVVERLRAAMPSTTLFRMDITEGDARIVGMFDAVSCMDVLFHVVDEARFEQALVNMRHALKPGGVLIISDIFAHRRIRNEKHFVNRSLERYEAALQRAGLRIIDRRPMFHLLNRPMDSGSPTLWRWWMLVERVCRTSYALGGIMAILVYPLELLFVRIRREGVSTEIMVCTAV